MKIENNIIIKPVKVEYVKDQLGSNALNFREKDGYFSISVSLFLEGDDILDAPYFEYCDQANGQYGGLKAIRIKDRQIDFEFSDSEKFCKKASAVNVLLDGEINFELVDFMINYLFLKEFIVNETELVDADSIEQSNQRS